MSESKKLLGRRRRWRRRSLALALAAAALAAGAREHPAPPLQRERRGVLAPLLGLRATQRELGRVQRELPRLIVYARLNLLHLQVYPTLIQLPIGVYYDYITTYFRE